MRVLLVPVLLILITAMVITPSAETSSVAPHSIPLGVREPLMRFDPKRAPSANGNYPDARVYQYTSKRDPVPVGGGIGSLGMYYAPIEVAGQPFRVVLVSIALLEFRISSLASNPFCLLPTVF